MVDRPLRLLLGLRLLLYGILVTPPSDLDPYCIVLNIPILFAAIIDCFLCNNLT